MYLLKGSRRHEILLGTDFLYGEMIIVKSDEGNCYPMARLGERHCELRLAIAVLSSKKKGTRTLSRVRSMKRKARRT